jgi:lipoyl(octanoyl) transferase
LPPATDVTRPLRQVWLGSVPYSEAWELQRRIAAARATGFVDDCVLLLEHPPVYTLGRNTDPAHTRGGPDRLRALGAECIEVDRGGSITFHGPGQLVAYPIVHLASSFPFEGGGDVVAYVRALEEALIVTAASCGVVATRRAGYTGAWVGEAKLAAIGVKLASGGITQHGVALNVSTEMRWFDQVVPCGITDGGVTSLSELGVSGRTPEALAPVLAGALATVLGLEVAGPSPALRGLCERLPETAPV